MVEFDVVIAEFLNLKKKYGLLLAFLFPLLLVALHIYSL